jgi:hypothetical protein
MSTSTDWFASVGFILAFAFSYAKWASFWLALGQALFGGWIYVVYYLIRYGSPFKH